MTRFAKTYSKKYGIAEKKMIEKLWGDNYFDQKSSKWKDHNEADDGSQLKRAFVQFIMEPVIKLCRASKGSDLAKVEKMLSYLDIVLSTEEKQK